MQLKKTFCYFAILCLNLWIINASAASHSVQLTLKKPYPAAVMLIYNHLEQSVAKQPGLFNSGLKIEHTEMENTTIFHVRQNQMTGEIFGDLGSVVIEKEKGYLIIEITDTPDLTGQNLHLVDRVPNWFK